MKEPIYHAIVNFNYYGYQIMAITSEKNHHIFGRFVRNLETTHTTKDRIKAKFNSYKEAADKLEQIKAICKIADNKIKILSSQMDAIHKQECDEIDALLTSSC
jgi:hypothetical protein